MTRWTVSGCGSATLIVQKWSRTTHLNRYRPVVCDHSSCAGSGSQLPPHPNGRVRCFSPQLRLRGAVPPAVQMELVSRLPREPGCKLLSRSIGMIESRDR